MSKPLLSVGAMAVSRTLQVGVDLLGLPMPVAAAWTRPAPPGVTIAEFGRIGFGRVNLQKENHKIAELHVLDVSYAILDVAN